MPAVSVAQRQLFAIAEHHPDELHAKNRSLLKLSHKQLHDFAATKEKGLPKRKKASRKKSSQFVQLGRIAGGK